MSPLVDLKGRLPGPRRLCKPRSLVQLATLFLGLYLCYILGLFTHMLERDLADYRYPLKIDINIAINTLKRDEASHRYLDVNHVNFTFLHRAEQVCQATGQSRAAPYMVILVKSKYSHFENRRTIRHTWGKPDPERLIRTVFLIGVPSPDEVAMTSGHLALPGGQQIQLESDEHGDLVQQDFYDTYYNNTLKTLMGLRWVNEFCTTSTFYLFIDDDYYLNPNLLVRFLETNITDRRHALSTLYAGYVFANSAPMRHILSKWYISLGEYPYNRYPPYVSAGCYVMSLESVRLFYMASKLIEKFKLDDIYLGILAHKLDIKPLHIPDIYFYPPAYEPAFFATTVLASHQFENEALKEIWAELEPLVKFTGFGRKTSEQTKM